VPISLAQFVAIQVVISIFNFKMGGTHHSSLSCNSQPSSSTQHSELKKFALKLAFDQMRRTVADA